MTHDLKVWPEYYAHLVDGSKTFEIRINDRGYRTGDTLILREWGKDGGYTGQSMRRAVGFMFSKGLGLDLGEYVVMSLLEES